MCGHGNRRASVAAASDREAAGPVVAAVLRPLVLLAFWRLVSPLTAAQETPQANSTARSPDDGVDASHRGVGEPFIDNATESLLRHARDHARAYD